MIFRYIAPVAIIGLLSGCASTARVNQFKAFAELGAKSQTAVGKIVDEAVASNVDADSQRLITARRLATKTSPPSVNLSERIVESNSAVIAHTEALTAFKRHSALLSDYFAALGALAAFDGESGITDSAKSTVTALQSVSPKLKDANIGEAPVADFVGAVAGLAVAHFKAKALENELRANGAVIERALDLERAFLDALNEDMMSDYGTLSEQQLLVDVIKPFSAPSGDLSSAWITKRRSALLAASTRTEPVKEAAALARKLHQSFIALAEGRLEPGDLALYAADLDRLVDLVEMVTAKSAGDNQ